MLVSISKRKFGAPCVFVTFLDQIVNQMLAEVPSELSARGTKQGVRNLPGKTLPMFRLGSASQRPQLFILTILLLLSAESEQQLSVMRMHPVLHLLLLSSFSFASAGGLDKHGDEKVGRPVHLFKKDQRHHNQYRCQMIIT